MSKFEDKLKKIPSLNVNKATYAVLIQKDEMYQGLVSFNNGESWDEIPGATSWMLSEAIARIEERESDLAGKLSFFEHEND